jgi:hypothetical protein
LLPTESALKENTMNSTREALVMTLLAVLALAAPSVAGIAVYEAFDGTAFAYVAGIVTAFGLTGAIVGPAAVVFRK